MADRPEPESTLSRREALLLTVTGFAGALAVGCSGAEKRGAAQEAEARPERVPPDKQRFHELSQEIYDRHWQQTHDTVAALKKKYEQPKERVEILDALKLLAQCVDPTDTTLYCTNQLVHSLQVIEGMIADGIRDKDMHVAALTHDLGKALLLTEEAPENVVCANTPIGTYERGVGLDNVVFQWNHDEFAYMRLGRELPDHVGWLIRYHSIDFKPSLPFMDQRDLTYYEKYLKVFRKYDQGTKSVYALPAQPLEAYGDLLREYFPRPIAL